MKLRHLLGHIDDPEHAGVLSAESPVFVIVRNPSVGLDSPVAWSAVSLVGVELEPDEGAIGLIADESDDAADVTIAEFRSLVSGFSSDAHEYELRVGSITRPGVSTGVRMDAPIVDTYIDENGIGLMAWFEGYEAWRKTSG